MNRRFSKSPPQSTGKFLLESQKREDGAALRRYAFQFLCVGVFPGMGKIIFSLQINHLNKYYRIIQFPASRHMQKNNIYFSSKSRYTIKNKQKGRCPWTAFCVF